MAVSSLQDLRSRKFWVALLAELLGTALLVAIGAGSCLSKSGTDPDPNGAYIRIALTFGLTVATLVWALCNVSGGHINPAVTVGFVITRRISLVRFFLYVLVQCAGAVLGALLLQAVTDEDYHPDGFCTSDTSTGAGALQVFGVEVIITFAFVLTVFGSADVHRADVRGSAPLSIGIAIAIGHLWAIPHSGAGMNPARVLGTAVVGHHWNNHWVYWVGPLAGGAVAALVYEFLFADNATPAKIRACCSRLSYDDDDYDRHGELTETAANRGYGSSVDAKHA